MYMVKLHGHGRYARVRAAGALVGQGRGQIEKQSNSLRLTHNRFLIQYSMSPSVEIEIDLRPPHAP